jgi:hypothetical protein
LKDKSDLNVSVPEKLYVEIKKETVWKNEYVGRGCWRVNPEVQYLDMDVDIVTNIL